MDVKKEIRESGVRQWQVAEQVGVSEFTLSRWLRRPGRLKPEVVKKIQKAISEIKGRKGVK